MLQRIQKILASAGIGSRRACEKLILDSKVMVNGRVAHIGDNADANKDIITANGVQVKLEDKKYIMLNKPKGYVSTVTEPFGMRTVLDLVKVSQRVYPVGRLDKDSEGLLLLTNDGSLAQQLTHPSYGVYKRYLVVLEHRFEDTAKLLSGVRVEGRKVKVNKVHKPHPNEVILEIHEGRKHIVRLLFGLLGYNVIKLARIGFGPLRLHGLKPGEWRYLTKEEVKLLKEASK